MSVLLDAVIICPWEDDEAIAQVNKYLYEKDEARHQQFEKMDNSTAGGTKVASMTVYQACFNHLSPDIVEEAYSQARWSSVKPMLILDYEFDDKLAVYINNSDWITIKTGR